MLIDSHSHIYSEDFKDDLDEVVKRAFENNIHKIVLPNIDSSSIKPMLDLTDSYPHICFPLMGLHPTSVSSDFMEELELVEFWLEKRKFYAIGEIGVDLYWDKTFLKEQLLAFRIQLQMAKKHKLPVVIHVRDSFDEVYSVLKEEGEGLNGVFHSFTGTLEQAEKVINMGFKIGVNGIVTFKNSGLDKLIENIDLSHILLETDAPYLTPTPFRGKRNESSYLIYVAQKVAEVHKISVSELESITTHNAEALFGI